MRKLAAASLGFSAAVFLANYILPVKLLPLLAVLCAAGAVGLLTLGRRWLRAVIIALFAFAAGLAFFSQHYTLTYGRAELLSGKTYDIKAKLLDYPDVYDDYCRFEVGLKTEGLPEFKALVYDSGLAMESAVPGDIVYFKGRLSSAGLRYGEKYDYYHSQGIYLKINTRSDLVIEKSRFDISGIPAKISRSIGNFTQKAFPHNTAHFMKSLMIGDKSGLYEDDGLYSSLSRAGLMHVVAVSGMHIAFLVSLIYIVLGRGRRTAIVSISLIWLFVSVTGASPSAVRAGIMQSILLLAPVFGRENDPPTSLSFALALILLLNPFAASSVSLQLSFGAMAGIMCFASKIESMFTNMLPKGKLRNIARYPLGIIATSLAVSVFTFPLCAIHFGYVSLLAMFSNVLCLFMVSVCFCGAYVAFAVSLIFFPAAALLAAPVSWTAEYIIAVAKLVSTIPFAAVYMGSVALKIWLVLSYALFIPVLLSSASKIFKLFLPLSLSLVCLCFAINTPRLAYNSAKGVICALDVGQGQCICVMSGKDTMLIDCGAINSSENAGERAMAYLSSCGRKKIDVLYLTHLHADHANGVRRLMELIDVGMLIMPANMSDDDGLLDKILMSAEEKGIAVEFISRDSLLELGGIRAEIYASGLEGDTNERCIMTKVSIDDYDMLVTGDASKEAERALIRSHEIKDMELLIVGHHGSRYSCGSELLSSIGADTAIISVGYNTYGHPTYETLERIASYGYNIYRTDLNGDIEIRIG